MTCFDVSAIPAEVLDVCRRLAGAGHAAHLVGGGIRDLLLGRQPADFDVATDALPEAVLALFGSRYAIPTGLQHGTVTVLAGRPPRHVEVTTFRGEGEYLDGRRPSTVSFSATLPEDLARRDFTMNAIAFDPLNQRLTDPFDGQGDLARKLVKAVGDPIKRFTEDGLRPMRAVRQATQLGFVIEPQTLAAIPATLASFRMVSGERVRDELFKMFRAQAPSTGVRVMATCQLLPEILPELAACIGCWQGAAHEMDVFEHSLAVMDALPPRPDLRLAGLLHDMGKPLAPVGCDASSDEHAARGAALVPAVAERLRLSVAERRLLHDMVSTHSFGDQAGASDADLRRLLRQWRQAGDRAQGSHDRVADMLALHTANRRARTRAGDLPAATQTFLAQLESVRASNPPLVARDLAVDGKALMQALQLPPGKIVGQLLDALLECVLDDPTCNSRESLVERARAIVSRSQ